MKASSHCRSGNKYPHMLNNLTKTINLLSVGAHIRIHLLTPRSVPLLFSALFSPFFFTSWGYNLKKHVTKIAKIVQVNIRPYYSWWLSSIIILVIAVLVPMIRVTPDKFLSLISVPHVLGNSILCWNLCSYSAYLDKYFYLEQKAFWVDSWYKMPVYLVVCKLSLSRGASDTSWGSAWPNYLEASVKLPVFTFYLLHEITLDFSNLNSFLILVFHFNSPYGPWDNSTHHLSL